MLLPLLRGRAGGAMSRFALSIAVASSLMVGCEKAEPPRQFSQDVLEKALADPGRQQEHDAADARRKPGPLIALAGVKPGDKVLDLIPGTGYWTRILSKIVGPEGRSMRCGRRPMRARRWPMWRT